MHRIHPYCRTAEEGGRERGRERGREGGREEGRERERGKVKPVHVRHRLSIHLIIPHSLCKFLAVQMEVDVGEGVEQCLRVEAILLRIIHLHIATPTSIIIMMSLVMMSPLNSCIWDQ